VHVLIDSDGAGPQTALLRVYPSEAEAIGPSQSFYGGGPVSTERIRIKLDEIIAQLKEDDELQRRMEESPETTLTDLGLGEEAAVILAEDWQGAMKKGHPGEKACEVRHSCRFTESTDPCGPTATSLRCPM
jgi:hypothetical protein